MNDLLVYLFRKNTSDQGTEGVFLIPLIFSCFSLELPWRDNKPNISCIPDGEYKIEWNYSNTFKRELYLVINVPGRSGIRIHSGNYAGDKSKGFYSHSLGCPLLGNYMGFLAGQKAVLCSGIAVKKFEEIMSGQKAKLIIQGGLK